MSWHVEPELLEAYARGEIDQARSFSVEAHVLECAVCRARMASLVDRNRLTRLWAQIEERVDTPRRGPVEVVLVRAGVPDHLARLLAATPSLTLSWFAAVATALAFAVTAAYASEERGLLLFLALAPLLPLAGVAAAYGPGLDPTYEIGLAAPIRSFRLLLIRSVAVVASTMALAGVAALALPLLDWRAAAWLLPALALTTLSLALATFVSPGVAFGWVAFVWIAGILISSTAAADRFAAFEAAAQVTFLLVTIGASLVIARRRQSFDIEESE